MQLVLETKNKRIRIGIKWPWSWFRDYLNSRERIKEIFFEYHFNDIDNYNWGVWQKKNGIKEATKLFAIYFEYTFFYVLLFNIQNIIKDKPWLLGKYPIWEKEEEIVKKSLEFFSLKQTDIPKLSEYSFSMLRIFFTTQTTFLREMMMRERMFTEFQPLLNFRNLGKIIAFFAKEFRIFPGFSKTLVKVDFRFYDRLLDWQKTAVEKIIADSPEYFLFNKTEISSQ